MSRDGGRPVSQMVCCPIGRGGSRHLYRTSGADLEQAWSRLGADLEGGTDTWSRHRERTWSRFGADLEQTRSRHLEQTPGAPRPGVEGAG